jgi:hypothetical protein
MTVLTVLRAAERTPNAAAVSAVANAPAHGTPKDPVLDSQNVSASNNRWGVIVINQVPFRFIQVHLGYSGC